MKSVTMFLLIVFLQSIASPAFAESADNHESRVIEVKLGTLQAMLDGGTQQESVAGMDATFSLYMDNVELIAELNHFHYLSASDRLVEDEGSLYELVELDPAYEYYESSIMEMPWDEDIAVSFKRHIFFSEDDKIIGEYVRFEMDSEIGIELAVRFVKMAENIVRANFGYVTEEDSPQAMKFWNYKFWLMNDFGDELEFAWYGQFVVFILRAGDMRPEVGYEEFIGLFLLSEEERANGVGH